MKLVQQQLESMLPLVFAFPAATLPHMLFVRCNTSNAHAACQLQPFPTHAALRCCAGAASGAEETEAEPDDDAAAAAAAGAEGDLPAELSALVAAASSDQEELPDLFRNEQLYGEG